MKDRVPARRTQKNLIADSNIPNQMEIDCEPTSKRRLSLGTISNWQLMMKLYRTLDLDDNFWRFQYTHKGHGHSIEMDPSHIHRVRIGN